MRTVKLAIAGVLALSGAGCASLDGYPNDPQPGTALKELRARYFSSAVDDCYGAIAAGQSGTCAGFTGTKEAVRDSIVLNRMHVYDMEFSLFVRELSAGNNSVTLGSDLTAFTLNGLAATTGDAPTKAALAAASAGVLSAKGAVNTDIFYQKTIPALIAEMEADRAKAEAGIYAGLRQSDASYPLARAVLDLDMLGRAGSINGAVASITQKADKAKDTQQDRIAAYRTGDISDSVTAKAIRTWLKAGDTDAKFAKLQNWWKDNAPGPLADTPFEELMDSPKDDVEKLRSRAIDDLDIK
jgi:hypothetical protein